MKIGLVGYAKPDVESLLQAYAIKQFLSEYDADCFYTEEYNDKSDSATEVKRSKSMADRMIHREYLEAPYAKAAKVQREFITDEIGFDKNKDKEEDAFVMVNYKAMVDMTENNAAYHEFYQRSFEKGGDIIEALLLLEQDGWNELARDQETTGDYIVLDVFSEKSPLVSVAQKISELKKMPVISFIKARKYYSFETAKEVYDPRDYLGYMKNAKLVITDNFMTTYFAVIFGRAFMSGELGTLAGKNRRFLGKLGLNSHYVDKQDVTYTTDFSIKNTERVNELLHNLSVEAGNTIYERIKPGKKRKKVDCPTDIYEDECCGCYACKEVCPVNAITMVQDKEGFYYPHVNDACIHCNLCAKVCVKKEKPQTVVYEESFPKAYCAINNDEEIRFKSSSGGVFPALAEYTINTLGGVVFGVKFNENMDAISTMAATMEEVQEFYGSKYVKSEINGVYPKVKEQLAAGKYVLYSGLPCECAGLRAYLRKDYDKLLVCEILCHAAPSPYVFKDYLKFIEEKFKSKVTNVVFREKSKGWLIHQCSLVFSFADRKPLSVNSRRNNYFRNFLKDNISRPGCAKCSFTARDRVGDITIGDFWGIHHFDTSMFDNKGASVVLVNNAQGAKVWNQISEGFNFKEKTIPQAFKYNHSKPMELKPERDAIFRRFREEPIDDLLVEFNDLKQNQ